MEFTQVVDARGLACPLPILRTKKGLTALAPGEILKVVATDPGSVKDMQAFVHQTENTLLASSEEAGEYVFYLQKN